MDKKDLVEGEFKSYNFLPPYNTILSNKTVYELTKKFTLKSMVSDGYNPKESIYDLYKISEADYEKDLAEDMSIIEFSLGSRRFYVPANRIISKELTTNIHYGERAIMIKVGWIPESENLNLLLEDIRLLVKDSLGIDPVIASDTIGVVVSIPIEEHNAREAERDILRNDPKNYKKKYYELKNTQGYTTTKLSSLELAELNSRLQNP